MRVVKWVIFLSIVVLLVGGWFFYKARKAAEANQPIVETQVVERGTVSVTVSGTGVIKPFTTVDVKSKAAGKVLKMAVEVGDYVKKGQLICLIDRDDTQSAYDQALADVKAALARVEQAQTSHQLQRSLTPTQIEEAKQQLASARASLIQAQKALRLQEEQNEAAIKQAKEALESARARLRRAEQQAKAQPDITRTAIEQAQANYEAALENLKMTKEALHPQTRAQVQATFEQAEASLRSAEENLKTLQENLRMLKEATHPQARAQAQANYDQAKANMENAQKTLKRKQELFAKGFIAQSEVDAAQTQYDVAKAQFESAREKLNTLKEEQDAELKATEAKVAAAQENVKEMKAALEIARERLKTLDQEQEADLKAAEAKVAQAKAALESAKANAVQDELRKEELAEAQAAVRQAEANLEAAQANAMQAELKRMDVERAQASVKQAEASFKAALANALQEKVRASDIQSAKAQTQRALAQLQNAKVRLEDTRVVAPRDGIILQKYIEEGTVIASGTSLFSQGTSIVQIADMSRVFVDTEVDETDIASVFIGQSVDITIDAFPDQIFEGKVTRIDPQTTEEQNVTYVHVQVELDMPDPRLKPGMTATCDFIVERKENVLVVPSEAVKEVDGQTIVEVVVDKEPKVALKNQKDGKSLERAGSSELMARRSGQPSGGKPPLGEVRRVEADIDGDGKKEVRWIVPRKVQTGMVGNENTEVTRGLKVGETILLSLFEPQKSQPPPGMGGPTRRGPMGAVRSLTGRR